MELVDVAKRKCMDIAVGAHVGETSLLTRAALAIIQYLGNSQVATEGAFGRHLLREDLTKEVIEFDADANLVLSDLPVLQRSGLGLTVLATKLVSLESTAC